MKKRGLVIGLLIMLAMLTSGFTYAFWASDISNADTTAVGSINIGQGDTVTTTVAVGDQDLTGGTALLVPVGYEDGVEVSQLDLTFSVNWSGTGAEGAAGTLAVTVDSVKTVIASPASTNLWSAVGNLYGDMFTVTVQSGTGAIVAGTPQDVVVRVVFTNEPASQAIYDLVATGVLQVTLSFDVTAA